MSFRYSTVIAVSTVVQASSERESLESQSANTRQFGDRNGGAFVREYRAIQSRADYWDWRLAMNEIPDFAEFERDAMSHKFDVVIVDSFDRLGSLAYMFMGFLNSLKIQLRSVQQASPIVDPAIYNPRQDDSTAMLISSSMSVQTYRINKGVRASTLGVSKRAKDGKFALQCPYGYVKVDKDTVRIDDNVAPLLRRMVDMYLSGHTTTEIRDMANGSGVPSKRGRKWSSNIIMATMQNPFYAGKTFYRRWTKDSNGNYRPIKDFTDVHDGKHEPLWSWETHLQLVAEIRRRHKIQHQHRDWNFTGLIRCSVCNSILHVQQQGKVTKNKHAYWKCDKKHVSIPYRKANELVAAELARLFGDVDMPPDIEQETEDFTRREKAAVERSIARLDAAFRAGAYEPEEYATERQALLKRKAEAENAEHQQAEYERRYNERKQIVTTMREIIDAFPEWIANQDPRQVKYYIGKVVSLTAHPDGRIVAKWL